ncbi:ABC transporter permease [bacterium]|nr:ABC transporter permease [bacterium]
MIIPVLAAKNTFRAGIKTWLNSFVLSLSIVTIIWLQGIYKGMELQASKAMIDAELGGGQYWAHGYDPYDPFSIDDSHQIISPQLSELIEKNAATPILITRGMLYKDGRVSPVLLKGIDPVQKILTIPSHVLKNSEDGIIPALIGTRMAKSARLQKGDIFTVQWKDSKGAFDAINFQVVEIMKTDVQNIDNNQLWVPLATLQGLFGLDKEATIIVLGKNTQAVNTNDNWSFKNLDFLLQDLKTLVQAKTAGGMIFYVILIFLAMIAIFDTQTLSIFKRKKEIGTLMALGMTNGKVVALFTFEGIAYNFLADLIAFVYGFPLMYLTFTKGWKLPAATDSYGFALGDTLYPHYSLQLIFGTLIILLILTAVVSYLPARKISKLKPTKALRGSTI